MKTLTNRLCTGLFLLLALLLTASCSDWKDIESVDIAPKPAKEQNPELWARYMESLRIYKQALHYIREFRQWRGTIKERRRLSSFTTRFTGYGSTGQFGKHHRL